MTAVHFPESQLAWLDLLLHRQILRLRAKYQLSMDEFRGLYISDQQVDELLRKNVYVAGGDASVDMLTEQARSLYRQNREKIQPSSPWCELINGLGLSEVEEWALLLALALELDQKYETLYAYLNDDISRKQPTHDLALKLFCETDEKKSEMRRALLPNGRLYGMGLVRPITPGEDKVSWLNQGMAISPVVCDFLLGMPPDARLPPYAHYRGVEHSSAVSLPSALQRLPGLFVRECAEPTPWLLLTGQPGTGRSGIAEALACELGRPLLNIQLERLIRDSDFVTALSQLLLMQRLTGATLFLHGVEDVFDALGSPASDATYAIEQLSDIDLPIIVSSRTDVPWQRLLPRDKVFHYEVQLPDEENRKQLWNERLEHAGMQVERQSLKLVAERFSLSPGQIREAVGWVERMRYLRGGSDDGRLGEDQLLEAARNVGSGQFGRLAVKVEPMYSWKDLVLHDVVMQQVEEVVAAIRYRKRVYVEWGMAQRFGGAGGVNVLFSGASGTGKTMTASVLARDLGLDLFRIDLSGIVSKYIGETEKNLDEIFRAARSTNAILFFDEADALFGKRSEVKDAHDRYANIEVSYLLQKMEEYDGAVILASNLSKNIDPAFSRRMHYVVEFPLPDEVQREKLWYGMFPSSLPLDDDVDVNFIARQFRLAGGDIRNIVLSATFLAASRGGNVTMQALMQATARQMVKQGKLPSANEFKHYFPLVNKRS